MIPKELSFMKSEGAWFFAAMLLYIGYKIAEPFIQDYLQKRSKALSLINDASSESMEYDYIKDIIAEFKADKGYIMEAHNGGKYASGNDIKKLSMKHEYNRPHSGLDYVSQQRKDIIVSGQFAQMVDNLIQNKFQAYPTINSIPEKFDIKRNQMKYDMLKSCYNFILEDTSIVLKNGMHPVLGIFSMYFKKEVYLSHEAIQAIQMRMIHLQNLIIKQ